MDNKISDLDKKHAVHIVDVSWSFKLLYILLGIAALGQIKADSWIVKLIEYFFSKIFFR